MSTNNHKAATPPILNIKWTDPIDLLCDLELHITLGGVSVVGHHGVHGKARQLARQLKHVELLTANQGKWYNVL